MKPTISTQTFNLKARQNIQDLLAKSQSMAFNQFLILGKRWAPSFAYNSIRKTMFNPPPFRISEKAKQWLARANESEYHIPQINRSIKLWSWGEGTPILLVHGWGARGIQLHYFIPPLLEKGYQVITLDFPGHGQSEGEGTSFLEWCYTGHELRRILPDLSGIIAHSMGCSIAQFMAAKIQNPDLRLTLMAPHYHLRQEFKSWLTTRKLDPAIMDNFISLGETVFGLPFDEHDPIHNAPQIPGDVLLVHDHDDRAAEYSNSLNLQQKLRSSKLISTRKMGHNKILRDQQVIGQIVDFMTTSTS